MKDYSVERVRNDSIKFGVAQGLHFVVGFFKDTLPALVRDEPNLRLSVLRMDGDTYDATMLALETFYDRVSPGDVTLALHSCLCICMLRIHLSNPPYTPLPCLCIRIHPPLPR